MIPPPRTGDAVLAVALLVASISENLIATADHGAVWLVIAVSAIGTLPLAYRRAFPLAAVVGAAVATVLPALVGERAEGLALLVAALMAIHSVNAYGALRQAMAGTALALASILAVILLSDERESGDLLWATTLYLLAAGSGQALAAFARSEQRVRAAAEREAIAAERRAVAADLHDVVANGLALMVVQAGAAAAVLESDPARARLLLDGVQSSGGRSASELDRLLQVLAPGRARPQPSPDLRDLAGLAAQTRSAGFDVDLAVVGDPGQVPPPVSQACYRVVQESVTNAVKHMFHPGLRIAIRIDGSDVGVTVEADGPMRVDEPRTGGGHGLAAMAERVALFGGSVSSQAVPTGWRTAAVIPGDRAGAAR